MLDRPVFSVPQTLGYILTLEKPRHPTAEGLYTLVVGSSVHSHAKRKPSLLHIQVFQFEPIDCLDVRQARRHIFACGISSSLS